MLGAAGVPPQQAGAWHDASVYMHATLAIALVAAIPVITSYSIHYTKLYEIFEQVLSHFTFSFRDIFFEEAFEIMACFITVIGIDTKRIDQLTINVFDKTVVLVIYERKTARHTRTEVDTRFTEDHGNTAGHVFTRVRNNFV